MVNWLKKILRNPYRFIWHDCLQMREPFTCQLSRMIVANGIFFWIPYVVLQWAVFFALYDGTRLAQAIGLGWLLVNSWLCDHLIDYIRNHPENAPNTD